MSDAKSEIEALVELFFDAFRNRGREADVDRLRPAMLPDATILKRTAEQPVVVWSVDAFLEPRRELLRSGRVRDFVERETSERTEIRGGLAQRCSTYEKSGIVDGVPTSGRGTKMFQFVDTPAGWRISAVIWEDDAT